MLTNTDPRERETFVNDPLIFQVDRVHFSHGAASLGELCRDNSCAGPDIKDLGAKERTFLFENPDDLLGLAAPRVEIAAGVARCPSGVSVHENPDDGTERGSAFALSKP